MLDRFEKSYPTGLQAIHLVILYIFIQTIVDFPLALVDYYKDTDYLYHPVKKIILGVGSVLFILYYGYRKSRDTLSGIFPMKKFNLLVLLPIVTFFWAIQNVLNIVNAEIDKVLPPPAWFWELFNKVFESDYGWFGAFMKVAIIAPVVEELIFRGVIMRGFMKNYPGWLAVFLSALLFALFHLNPWQFPATFMLGLLLGWLMLEFRNILLCIIGHSVNNFLVLLSLTYWEKIQEMAIYKMDPANLNLISAVIAAVSVSGISLLIYLRKRKAANTRLN